MYYSLKPWFAKEIFKKLPCAECLAARFVGPASKPESPSFDLWH